MENLTYVDVFYTTGLVVKCTDFMQYNDFISINFGVLYISTVLVALLARIAKDELLLLLTLQMY